MSRVRANEITNQTASGAPRLSHGAVSSGVITATSFDGNITGDVTGNITGDVTGNITGDVTGNLIGNITGTAATFTGNVSVGGTLTYEDVTNVDSVGVITARTGIKVLAGGINAVGVVTATSFSGDGSNLSGVESGVANFVASGTIPNGAPVVLNSDGTVSVITSTVSSTPYASVNQTFNDGPVNYTSCVYDSTNGKVIIAYRDNGNSDYGTAIVGTVSGTSISFGPPIIFNAANTTYISATFDSTNNKVVIAYENQGNSNYGTAVVGTVSGSSISFGTPVVFESANSDYISTVYDSTNGKVVIVYRDGGNSSHGTAIVGTVSGTSISFGSAVVFNSANSAYISATFDSTNNKVVISFQDVGASSIGRSIIGTVSGTSISFGSKVTFNSATGTNWISSTFDSNSNKVVIAYRDAGNSDYGTAIVGTVSGTSISFGSGVVFESADVSLKAMTFDSTNNKIVIGYRDSGNSSYGTAVVGTVSGTSISFGTPFVINGVSTSHFSTVYDPGAQQTVIAYYSVGNIQSGRVVVLTSMLRSSNLTTGNYIGIAAEAISSGATGKINIVGGTNTGQTGLTIGKTYYVRSNGDGINLGATDPVVVAGTAISATNIIVR